jgi:hypothetical protein
MEKLTTDQKLCRALAGITKIKSIAFEEKAYDALDKLNDNPVTDHIPFSLSHISILWEPVRLITGVLFQKTEKTVQNYLDPVGPGMYLVWDAVLRGQEALFVVYCAEDFTDAQLTHQRWARKSPEGRLPAIVGASKAGVPYLVCQLKNFFP